MKLNAFEKIIRKVVREEIDYALRREISLLKEELSGIKPIIKEKIVEKVIEVVTEVEVIKEVEVEKPIEVIKEVPVEKVVIKEVPKEIVRKELVYVPLYSSESGLVDAPKNVKEDKKK